MKQRSLPVDSRDASALHGFATAVREVLGERLVEIKLFGSKARGEGNQESDIDVLVVVAEADLETKNRVLDEAFNINLAEDVFIAPLIIDRSRLADPVWRITDLAVALDREGIPL